MNIRTAKPNDIKTLQNLNDEVFVDNAKYDSDLKLDWAQSEIGEKYFTDLLSNKSAICLIAEENNQPIGYIAASPKTFSHRLSRYVEIENIGVIPTSRSKGVGSQLINECLKIAKEMGYQRIYLNTYFENIAAVNFYEKNGFKKIDLCLEKDL